ncbi:BamA/TamA family outer membrane protein [Candidatus Poribacteria bacterium]|nr:BamA/TamA family outer membrane protein [Candidatus Poribacteria bacterium]
MTIRLQLAKIEQLSRIMSTTSMKKYIFIVLLLLIASGLTHASTTDGTIAFDYPDAPHAKFQFHFTRELIALAGTTAPFNTVSDIYFRTYDAEAGIFDRFVQYYGETLKAKNWQSLQEDNGVHLYVLEGSSAQNSQSDKAISGIFAVVESDSDVYLLNIVGNIPPQQIRQLLTNLGQIGIEISALKSLEAQMFQRFEKPPKPMSAPTLLRTTGKQPDFFRVAFSTKKEPSRFGFSFSRSHNATRHGQWRYYGHPIEQIQIRSDSKERIAQISQALEKGSTDIEAVIESLPSVNTSGYKKKLIVHTSERLAMISVGHIPDHKNEPFMLAKRFRTSEGEPIHEIRIRGHQDIHLKDVRKALEKGPEDIEKAIGALPSEISGLEAARLRIEGEGAQRTAIVTIVEQPLPSRFYFDRSPWIGFNRVTGWELGARIDSGFRKGKRPNTSYNISVPSEFRGDMLSKFFGRVGYGFGNKQFYYRVGSRVTWGEPDSWYLGLTLQYYRATSVIAPELFPFYDDTDMTILRVLGMPDHQNYYLREGDEVALQWRPIRQRHSFKLARLAESHDSLQKSTDWHFFNWRSKSEVRENPAVTPGRMRSFLFKYDYSTRHNFLGWHNTFFVEHSDTAIGSDFDFTRYQLHLRYAHPVGRHQIRTRAVGSFSTAPLPIQRQFIIGGPGLLNGYPLYAFAGDRGFLFNIEYLFHLPALPNWKNVLEFSDVPLFLVLFLDAGQAWNASEEKYVFEPKSNAGIGLQLGETDFILRFNVSKAFEADQGIRFNTAWFYSF